MPIYIDNNVSWRMFMSQWQIEALLTIAETFQLNRFGWSLSGQQNHYCKNLQWFIHVFYLGGVRVEFKSGSRVILQCQDGSISNEHSCADQSGETLLFLFKFRLGLIRRGGLENLIWWQSGKGEEVCVFKLSKGIGFRLPHNRVIDICLDFFLLVKHGRKRIFYHKCQELSSFCSFLLEAANKLFGLPPSPPMRNSSKWIQSETLLHFS